MISMATERKLILVTNDDGIDAPGLEALRRLASAYGDVVAVAPASPQSGMSAAITVTRPLHFTPHPDRDGCKAYSVDGTPVDCVKLALHTILPRRPDLLLSGINHGTNAATAIVNSGTMGAVLEGCMNGIPSVGFSLLDHHMEADFTLSAGLVSQIISKVAEGGLPHYVALNVNIPAGLAPKGVRACRAACGHWTDEFAEVTEPDGRTGYRLRGDFIDETPHATDTDLYWLGQGYASIVPVTPDMTKAADITAMAKEFNTNS